MASFTHVAQDVSPQYGRVTKITIRVCVTDCTGTVYITDMLLPVSYTHLTLPTILLV